MRILIVLAAAWCRAATPGVPPVPQPVPVRAQPAPLRASAEDPAFRLELAQHYAPVFYQDLNSHLLRSVADVPLRFDFDRDWSGMNNWKNMFSIIRWQRFGKIGPGGANPGGWDLGAYVYYGVVESRKHWFISYSMFHAQDWSDDFLQVSASQHANDMEGVTLTVEKDGSRYGKPLVMQAQAHGHFFLYTAQPGIQPSRKAKSRDEMIFTGSHPRVYVETEGHGMAAGRRDRDIRYAWVYVLPQWVHHVYLGPGGPTKDFANHDGWVYEPSGVPQYALDPALDLDPRDPGHRTAGYGLLSIDELWDRRDAPETMALPWTYQGSRFSASAAVGSAFNGYKWDANPPWYWTGEGVRTGDTFFDPAWAVYLQFDFSRYPGGFDPVADGDYLYNPYLRAVGARLNGEDGPGL